MAYGAVLEVAADQICTTIVSLKTYRSFLLQFIFIFCEKEEQQEQKLGDN